MPPLVYSRVAIRIGFCRLQPTGAREGKDHGDTDAHSARYQETRPAGDVPRADSTVVHVDRGRSRSTADMRDLSPEWPSDRGFVGTCWPPCTRTHSRSPIPMAAISLPNTRDVTTMPRTP